MTHGQFGPRLYYADDHQGEWRQAQGPVFPEDAGAAVERIWVVEPGEEDGVLWAGWRRRRCSRAPTAAAAGRSSTACGTCPAGPQWEGGLGGLALHSICPWPGDPSRLAVGISAAGVWITEDGGESWRRGGKGLVPRYLPEEAREGATMLCVHNMRRAPLEPRTLYLQFHGGVYRSDDEGDTWIDISAGLPADFGFPLAVDPRDPDRAFVIPLTSDDGPGDPRGPRPGLRDPRPRCQLAGPGRRPAALRLPDGAPPGLQPGRPPTPGAPTSAPPRGRSSAPPTAARAGPPSPGGCRRCCRCGRPRSDRASRAVTPPFSPRSISSK